MSAKIMSSLADDNRDLGKQIGCMNGIFQIFDRHHFISGRRISGHNHKRLLTGAQHQSDPQYARKAASEKDMEVQKEKPRISTESSRASYSSSSCSSTFSSEAHSLRKVHILDSPQSSVDFRDVVKDSMHREARALSIKSIANNEGKSRVMKHIDSPRPLDHSKLAKAKSTSNEGPARVLAKDDRLALPRYSYDGRESRETFKSGMKHKEFPRLSLDSKASTLACSTLEPRLNLFRGDLQMENEIFGNGRSSSVVAKLMGLEAFPDENRTPAAKSFLKEEFLSQSTTTSPKLHNTNSLRKPSIYSRSPMEPAPSRQNDCPGSPKIASQSRKPPTSNQHSSSSVYGEIEKRITNLEFKKSGKDLRALKQILEAMQKTKARLETQNDEFKSERRCSFEESCSAQDSHLSMRKDTKGYNQVSTIKGPYPAKQLKPVKVMDKVKIPNSGPIPTSEISHRQMLQTQERRYPRSNSTPKQGVKDLTPKRYNPKDPSRLVSPVVEDNSWRTAEPHRTSRGRQRMRIENCTSSARNPGMVSPTLHQNRFGIEGQSHPTIGGSDRVDKHLSKKLTGKVYTNGKVKPKDQQFSDDQLSVLSCDTRAETGSVKSESKNNLVSKVENEVLSLARSINTNAMEKKISVSPARQHSPAVETAVTMVEQPSPISVLDDPFYCEDSPSPIKKISTAFREDEVSDPDDVQWHLRNLNDLQDCTRFDEGYKNNQKLGNMKQSTDEARLLNMEPDRTAENHNAFSYGSLNPDHEYISKVLLTTGLLKETTFMSSGNQLFSSRHLINPDMFDVLEQTEDTEGASGEFTKKSDMLKLNKKIQRKILFDLVNEILVRKISSGRLFTATKSTSPQRLLKEVYLEMDRVCQIPKSNLDDEDDETTRLLAADMMYESDDWAVYGGEIPALVLDMERLIFKDLVNEVVTGEVMGIH